MPFVPVTAEHCRVGWPLHRASRGWAARTRSDREFDRRRGKENGLGAALRFQFEACGQGGLRLGHTFSATRADAQVTGDIPHPDGTGLYGLADMSI